jgi:hypothetical protein
VADSLRQHRSSRLLIVDHAGRLLLFRYADEKGALVQRIRQDASPFSKTQVMQ